MASAVLDRLVGFSRHRPDAAIAWVLGLHVAVWTVMPILVCPNLQLDLVEGLALGKEWQLGYWKHPPLPWLVTDLIYRATGSLSAVYLLGPLSSAAAMYVVWRLAREVVEPQRALIAVLALEGLHYLNFSVVKFAHDQMQLPFWALTGWFFYRATANGKLRDWLLAGACLALAFWSKYAAAVLAVSLGLFLLIDRDARKSWRTPGPYAMAAAFLLVLAPNLWWLAEHDFLPFRYADQRAVSASAWYHYVVFPLQWTGGQIVSLLPVFILLAVALVGARWRGNADDSRARRCVTMLALGPFLVVTAISAVLGRLPIAMWGYPFWLFLPLAAVMWFDPALDDARLRRFAAAFLVVFAVMPAAYVAVELGEPFLRDRPKATKFPGQQLADTLTRTWRERFGTPLRYVGGSFDGSGPGEFAANNVAVYSADRPRVIVHGEPELSPWIDPADLDRHGALFVWQGQLSPTARARLLTLFPRAELQPALELPRQVFPSGRPERIGYAVLPPRG